MLEKIHIDEGSPGFLAGPYDLTRMESWVLEDASGVMDIPGGAGEHLLFRDSPNGRMSPAQFADLIEDLKENGMHYPVTVHVEKDLRVMIYEGNHRLRAAIKAGCKVKVEIKYFGNSQKAGLLRNARMWDSNIGKI